MEITKTRTVEEVVTVNLYHHWLGDQWIFVAEVVENGKKEVYDAFLMSNATIKLRPTRYCDKRDHAWFRKDVQHHGNCHHVLEYRKNWNRAVKSHMIAEMMGKVEWSSDQKRSFAQALKDLDSLTVTFA